MYEKKQKGWRKHIDFILLDILCLQLAFVLAYFIRFGLENPYVNNEYRSLAGVYILIDLLVAVMFDSFKNVLRRGYYKEFTAVLKHVCFVEAAMLMYLFSTQRGDVYSRLFFYYMIPLYLLLTYIGRTLWKGQLRAGKTRRGDRSLLIVAPKEKMEECISSICERNYNTYRKLEAVVTDASLKGTFVSGIPVVTDYETIVPYVQHEWVDEVFLCGDAFLDEHTMLIEQLRRMGIVTHIAVAKRNHSLEDKQQQIGQLGDYTVMTTSLTYASGTQLFFKRAMDLAGSLVGCLITMFLTIMIGPMIYISSPGPIFFIQERVGKNGKKWLFMGNSG